MNFCYQYECDVSIMSACIIIPMVCSFCSFDELSWYTEDHKLTIPAVTIKDMLEVALHLILLFSCCSSTGSSQQHSREHTELYIKATPTQLCPQGHLCHTLVTYLHNTTVSFSSNTTLHFLPGNHSAVSPQPTTLVISNISNLVLTGPEVGPGEPPQAIIRCNHTVQFRISDPRNVSLQGLYIQGCGGTNIHSTTADLTGQHFSYAMLFDNVHSLVVENLWMRQCHGSGLVTYNCFEHVSIKDCYFDGNYYRSFSALLPTSGNALIYYDTATRGHTNIEVINSEFLNGQCQYCTYEPVFGGSGGLNVFFMITTFKTEHVFNVSVTNCSFVNNAGYYGGNMYVRHESSNLININLFIQHSSFINGTSGRVGGGLGIRTQRGGSFNIINSTFTQNFVGHGLPSSSAYKNGHGGGVHIQMNVSNIVTIVASRFLKNIANKGGGFYISITEGRGSGGVKSSVLMSDVLFDRNSAIEDGGHGYILMKSLLDNCQAVVLYSVSGCLFERGYATRGGAISINMRENVCDKYSLGSYTVKIKNSKLTGNSAVYGTVFYVYSASKYVESHTVTRIHLSRMHIANNTALVSIIHISGESNTLLITCKTTFYNNTIITLLYGCAILYLEKNAYSWIIDTTFSNNIGSCTRSISSNITLQGYVKFYNNTAYAGAALLLDCQVDALSSLDSLQPSFLVLLPNATVTISNNTALYYGGGLAVNPMCNYNSSCFFQASSMMSTMVYFLDNKALISANSLYGPPITQCVNQGGQIEEEQHLQLYLKLRVATHLMRWCLLLSVVYASVTIMHLHAKKNWKCVFGQERSLVFRQ